MEWKSVFAPVAIGVGMFFIYAAWGSFPFSSATACAVSPNPGVHFTESWTLDYYNACGGHYDNFWLYLLGFTTIGLILIGGGAGTLREAIS
jgi:hypothetical protein